MRPCVPAPLRRDRLDAFGPQRVLFGSDWPVCPTAASYEQVVRTAEELTDGLAPDERAQVLGGTAARVHGLGTPKAAGAGGGGEPA
ncbi:amidohydrolase family protein [Streptomyces sp. c-19]|uniref:amidohydrolase family protein n=1 Tax=Streptomyces sp. c-19 TaxID=2789275 RepID=UPI003980C875